MFAKYCEGRTTDSEVSLEALDNAIPHSFDTARRTSVSAECWNCPIDVCSARTPRRVDSKIGLNQLKSTSLGSTGAPLCKILSSGEETEPASGVQRAFDPNDPDGKQALERASRALRNTIFFEELSDKLMEVVLGALEPLNVPANTEVIKQGDEGNELFILDKGKVEFYIDGKKKGEAESGSTFGELALLYNSPRAASVITVEPCRLFALDRVTFKRIMVAKLTDKRVHSQNVLATISAFSNIPESLCLRISDALHPVTFKKGDVIFKEGDKGEDFYLIDEGTVSVTKGGECVNTHSSGEYFGELALIYDHPRAATVTATSDTLKLEVLSKTGFEQLIGCDLVAELRRRDPRKANSQSKH